LPNIVRERRNVPGQPHQPLLPARVHQRSRRALQARRRRTVHACCQHPLPCAAERGSQRAWRAPAQAEALFNKDKQGAPLEAMLRVLDGKLAGRTFLFGEDVSAADVALASHLLFFRVFVPQVRLPGPRLPRAPLQRAAPGCQVYGRSSAYAFRQLQPEMQLLGVRACLPEAVCRAKNLRPATGDTQELAGSAVITTPDGDQRGCGGGPRTACPDDEARLALHVHLPQVVGADAVNVDLQAGDR